MLELLLGPSGYGKTTQILSAVRARAEQGGESLLVVPEQASATTEGLVRRTLGERLVSGVTVCSFRTLAERILDECGGGELPTVSEAGRAVLVRRALHALDPEDISQFGGVRRSASFCAACAKAVQELKTAGVTPQLLARAGASQPRLRQLALIFSAYEAQLAGAALDPSDRLTVAASRLTPGFFAGQEIFLDGFDGFTAPQYQLLRAMLDGGADLTAALCCPGLGGGEALFAPAQETARRLSRLASGAGVRTKVTVLQTDRRHAPGSGMALLADALQSGLPLEKTLDGVWLTPVQAPWQEAKYAAAVLAGEARKGTPYSRMAVVCRDKTGYDAALRRECRLMGVPLFEDENVTLQFSAPAAAMRAAVSIARRGLNAADILAFLKTGLVQGADAPGIAMLESYTQVWRMTADDWRSPLPEGRTLDGYDARPDDPAAKAEMAAAERVRALAAGPLDAFWQRTAPARTAQGMRGSALCEALYDLLEEVGAPACVSAAAARTELHSAPAADEQRRMWDAAMDLLDELYRLLEQDEVTAAEFDELLHLMLRGSDLGRIPQMLEAVLFTTADRLRPEGIDCCVVLGAADGQFPPPVGASGLLSHADRELLAAAGASLPGEFEQRVRQEELYFYRTAAAACCRTWFFYSQNGGEARPSSALAQAGAEQMPPFHPTPALLCPTPEAAVDWLCGRGGEEFAGRLPGLSERLEELQRRGSTPVYAVRDTPAMQLLLGRDLTISPSRMERFYRCRLAYFLEYVARLRAPRPARLDMRLGGALIHFILERALQSAEFLQGVEQQKESLSPDPAPLRQLAKMLAEEYLDTLPGQSGLSRREENTVRRIVDGMAPLLQFLQAEQAQSRFAPEAFELSIGPRQEQPGLSVPLPDGHTAFLTGKIDRVDAMQSDGRRWLRVVDYKTGGKDFSLDSVFYGLDAQMLLYLFSLCPPTAGGFADTGLPAGVLYLLADPKKQTASREKACAPQPPSYAWHGLVTNEEEVWRGMDAEGTGKYVPFGFKGKGERTPNQYSAGKLASRSEMARICAHLCRKLQQMGADLYAGQVDASPLKGGNFDPCRYCAYSDVCRRAPDAPVEEMRPGAGKAFRDDEQQEEDTHETMDKPAAGRD